MTQRRVTTGQLLRRIEAFEDAIERILTEMADLTSAEKGVEDAEGALEARVTAHEANLKAISADLQKQIDALKAAGDTSGVAAKLAALKGRIDGFEADAPAPVPAPGP